MEHHCFMSCLHRRHRPSDCGSCSSCLRRRSCLWWSRNRFGFHIGPIVSVRVLPQVDPWCHHQFLPMGYRSWDPHLQRFNQYYQGPTESLRVSHSHCNSIHLGFDPRWRHDLPSRGEHFRLISFFHRIRLIHVVPVPSLVDQEES